MAAVLCKDTRFAKETNPLSTNERRLARLGAMREEARLGGDRNGSTNSTRVESSRRASGSSSFDAGSFIELDAFVTNRNASVNRRTSATG